MYRNQLKFDFLLSAFVCNKIFRCDSNKGQTSIYSPRLVKKHTSPTYFNLLLQDLLDNGKILT